MNLAYFQMLLQESIDNATSTQDLLSLSQALEKLLLGQIRTVATYALLPDAATNEGLLVWVTSDERLYWSTGSAWYSIVTDSRSSVFSWGRNSSGQLGDNSTTSRSSPVSVVGGFTDWCQVSAGGVHTVAVRSNGIAWSWGSGADGRLGNNSTTVRSSPVSVVGGFSDWCNVSAGGAHTVAVRTGGTAWVWGCNNVGQLGDNTTTTRSSPVSVVGGFTNWCQASAGNNHSLAVRSNGTIWAWGYNGNGSASPLGDGTSISRSSPVSVIGGFTDWCSVSGGSSFSAAVRTNGSAWAWGIGGNGVLGNGTTTDTLSPVSVIGPISDWYNVSAGLFHTLAVRRSGSAWAWGFNGSGLLGNNTTTDRSSPVSVVGGFSDWCNVSAGCVHSLGVRSSGSAWSWGCNNSGRLGDNTTTNISSPVSVVGISTSWCQVSAGQYHSVALSYDDFV